MNVFLLCIVPDNINMDMLNRQFPDFVSILFVQCNHPEELYALLQIITTSSAGSDITVPHCLTFWLLMTGCNLRLIIPIGYLEIRFCICIQI